jgi:hypothetical protein
MLPPDVSCWSTASGLADTKVGARKLLTIWQVIGRVAVTGGGRE